MNAKVNEKTKWILLQEKKGYPPNTVEFTINKELSASEALRFLLCVVKRYGLDDLSTKVVE